MAFVSRLALQFELCVSLGILALNPGTIPSIILLSDCRKPEVFDIWNKLMLGSHIGDISIHTTFILFWASILSTLRRGLARSPPAERDHTWSTRLFASVYSQNSLVRIVRTVRTSQSVLFSNFLKKPILVFDRFPRSVGSPMLPCFMHLEFSSC